MELLFVVLKLIALILYSICFVLCSKEREFKPFYALSVFIISVRFLLEF